MSKIIVDDDFLYQHMPALGEKMARSYPEEELSHDFSVKFERNMKKMIRRVHQKEMYGIPIQTASRVAVLVIVFMIGFMLTAAHTKANFFEYIKEKLFSYEKIVYEKETDRRFYIPEGKAGVFVPLNPTYIPEGYQLAIKDEEDGFSYLQYEKNDMDGFAIQQQQITDGLLVSDDNEYIKEEKVTILGCPGRISYKEDGSIHIRWETESTLYLVFANKLPKEELLNICDGLEEK